MKRQFTTVMLTGLILALCAPVWAQLTATVKGVCKDVEGKPIAGATVQYVNLETGRKYQLKTNDKGEYFSLGLDPGKYTATLLKDSKELFHFNNVPVQLSEEGNIINFDLQKEMAQSGKQSGLTPEQIKQQQEQQAKQQKEVLTVKALNEKLATARQGIQTGTPDQAIQSMNEAIQMDPSKDILWFTLGDAYRSSATKQSDLAEKKKQYDQSAEAYQKALQLKQQAISEGQKDPDANKKLAAYYTNLGDALAKSGRTDDAVKAYNQAAQVDPATAAQSYYNLGATMTNAGKVDEAIEAFKKTIAADPNKAEAYYWLGVNMIGKATLKGDKMVAPEGTAQAFNKYLELQPNGPFAQPAKDMLASIGASVETTFGKKKASKTK